MVMKQVSNLIKYENLRVKVFIWVIGAGMGKDRDKQQARKPTDY